MLNPTAIAKCPNTIEWYCSISIKVTFSTISPGCSGSLLFHVTPVFFSSMQESFACSSNLIESSLPSEVLEEFSDSSSFGLRVAG